jgi:hypothetical protein
MKSGVLVLLPVLAAVTQAMTDSILQQYLHTQCNAVLTLVCHDLLTDTHTSCVIV